MSLIDLAFADHPGAAAGSGPLSPLAAALVSAGLAAAAVLIVFAVIAIFTRRPRGGGEDGESGDP